MLLRAAAVASAKLGAFKIGEKRTDRQVNGADLEGSEI